MPKRSRKKKTDLNVLASEIVAAATDVPKKPANRDQPAKNPAAVALGRLGGLKGGKARAKRLTAKERKAIAVKAARYRWYKVMKNKDK